MAISTLPLIGDDLEAAKGYGAATVTLAPPIEQSTPTTKLNTFDRIDSLVSGDLKYLVPIQPSQVESGLTRPRKYSAVVHTMLCRLKFLGFSDAEAARGAGIDPQTLKIWQKKMPMLTDDLERYAQLSKTRAATRLMELMDDEGKIALDAVKFFLTSRSPAFREEKHVVVDADPQSVIRKIRESIYGIYDEGEIIDAVVEDSKASIPTERPVRTLADAVQDEHSDGPFGLPSEKRSERMDALPLPTTTPAEPGFDL